MKYKLHFNLNKALDDVNKLLEVIKQFLNDRDYILYDLSGEDRNTFDAAWKFMNKKNQTRIFVSPKNMTVFKDQMSDTNKGEYRKFTREEARFFDGLGFELEPITAKIVGQRLDQWFGNSDDIKFELFEALRLEGYEEIWESPSGDFRYIGQIPAPNASTKRYKCIQLRWDDTKFYRKYTYYEPNSSGFSVISSNRSGSPRRTPVEFTPGEIYALREAGFEIKKANDELSFALWSKKIVEFLESQGYLITKVQEYQPSKGRHDLGYIKATKEKHMKNLQTGQTRVSPIEITVDREHNYVKLQRRHNALYFPEKLTNEELKFFDSMGLDLDEDNIRHQNIDDWFSEV